MQQTFNLKGFMKQSMLVVATICITATTTAALSCNYEGQIYNICRYANAWSYENGAVCVGISRCISQSPPYGVVAGPPPTTTTPPPTTTTPPPTTTTPPPTTTTPRPTPPPTTTTPAPPAVPKSPGCGSPAPFQSGVRSVTVNGKSRQYIVKLPSNYNPNNPYRLIFTFHWGGGDMYGPPGNNGGYYGLEPKAQGSAIFVSPNGFSNGWANNGGEDIAFVTELLKIMENGFCINQGLIFATGFSYGAGMSHSVACSLPNKFRAVTAIAGGLVSGCNGGTMPVAYQGIHGISDAIANISAGRQLRDHWVRVNGCQSQTPREPSQGSGTHITTEYQGCSTGHPVIWIAHDGGHVAEPADRGQGNFAPEVTWSFFTRFQ